MNNNIRYWIQEYYPLGENWIDYCSGDDWDASAAFKDLRYTAKAFPERLFRVIERSDSVMATAAAWSKIKAPKNDVL